MSEGLADLFHALRSGRETTEESIDAIREPRSKEDWLEQYQKYVRRIRHCAVQTDSLLASEIAPVIDDPSCRSDEWYEELYDWLRDMYDNDYDSPYVLKMLADVAVKHFEGKNDSERLMFCWQAAGYARLEASRMMDTVAGKESVALFKKVVAEKTRFGTFKRPENRAFIMAAYSNLIRTEYTLANMTVEEVEEVWEEFTAFRQTPEACAFDEAQPRIPQLAEYFDTDFRTYCANDYTEAHSTYDGELLDSFDPEVFWKLCEISRPCIQKAMKDPTVQNTPLMAELLYNDISLRLYNDEISTDEAYRRLVEMIGKRYDLMPQNEERLCDEISAYLTPLRHATIQLFRTSFDHETKERLCLGHWSELTEYAKTIKGFSATMNRTLFDFCSDQHILGCIHNTEEKERVVLEFVVARQAVTYIHSVMVMRAALLLLDSVLTYCPEKLVGLPDMTDVATVLTHREDIVQYVTHAALFHDIGKNTIVDIINVEERSLTDDEFMAIRSHPEHGGNYLQKIPDFNRYCDVAMGHHKFFDGSGGYPASFDNTKSPYKPVIDMITLCDCLDAATDFLGRSYHRAKTLEQVVGEFRQGAGTRYDPSLVRLLEEDKELREKLRNLLMNDRKDVYYETYRREFMEKKEEDAE